MKNLAVTIGRSLFSKHIAFCLYRFPGEKRLRLAIDAGYLPHQIENTCWIAPFSQHSSAKELFLPVLNPEWINSSFIQKIESIPPKSPFPDIPLPPASSKEDYLHKIAVFLQDIRSGVLEKAILSNVFYEEKPENFDPFYCFEGLSDSYPDTFVHLLVHPDAGIWLGASPELLLKKKDQEVSIRAIAGTQPRSESKIYEWRTKETEEHLMVGKHIEQVFQKFDFTLIEKTAPHDVETGSVAHIATDYIYEGHKAIELKPFLRQLHPTPAVGGWPAKKGVDYILEHEGYDRKYYCGFIGETDFEHTADLYINIRNMQIGKEKIAILAGGGLTADSDPEEEWQELMMKSKTMSEKIHSENTLQKNGVV
ncbi:MAG: chorismate-binding protein [Chitinophagaceae bacterium]|nr:chorismate-binding protein [Chitinophagaceae bacterium]